MIVIGALLLAYCSSAENTHSSYQDDDYASEAWEDDQRFEADDSSIYRSDEEKGGETRAEYEERQDEIGGELGTYHDDVCTVNCDGHEAGRQWAEDRGITDPSDCGGRSWSFQEGCETYAREQQEEAEQYEEEEEEEY